MSLECTWNTIIKLMQENVVTRGCMIFDLELEAFKNEFHCIIQQQSKLCFQMHITM